MEEETDVEKYNANIREIADKKSVKINPVDVSKLVDDEGKPIDLTNTMTLKKWLIQRYRGQEIEIADDGRIVTFTRRELEGSAKRRGEAQRQMYADIDEIIKSSVYAGYELGDADHPWVDRQNIYYAAAQIGDVVYGIRFKIDIRNDSDIGRYKDHKIVRIDGVEEINKKEPLPPYQGFSPSGIGSGQIKPPSPYRGVSPRGTEGGQTMPVSMIREAMGVTYKISVFNSKVNSKIKKVKNNSASPL